MSLKKVLSSIVIVAIFIIFLIVPEEVYAEKLSQDQRVTMGIQKLMSSNDPKMGYGINQPGLDNGAYIWNIVKYDSASASSYTKDNIYCVKAEVGFTTSSETGRTAPYDVFYNMKTERDKIKAQNAILSGLVDGTVAGINRYNAILAILDRLYLPGESTENEKKQLIFTILNCAMTDNDYIAYRDYADLLEQAFNLPADKDIVDLILENTPTKYALTEYALTDNDIKAVQQAVLWYFTNSENPAKYDKTSNENWLHYTLDGNDYSHTLNEYTSGGKRVGLARNVQAEILYNYLIRQAKANANNYANSAANAGAPAQVDTTTLSGDISGNNYVIGPIHITQLHSSPYTIDFVVKNKGTEITNYQLLDENKRAVSAGTTVKNLVGKNFYISVPKNQVEAITIDININYNETTMKLWASSTNNQEQPLVEVHKGKISVPVQLKFTPKKKVFDLALRKYITKVERDGEEIPVVSRVPNIDESSLATGTTATYKHKKDPVIIKTGDKVTYKITIYNEGEKEGRAIKVVDQLPTGLEFSKVISGNFQQESYNKTTNTLNLIRKSGNETNLPAYKTGNLTSGTGTETIEIECIVTATPDTKNDKILTNVAWISEEFDAEDNVTITNQKGADRDSEPETKPDVNKDNMSNYTGKDNKTDLTDSDYYYKGEQDDDDFEKLILVPEKLEFDLALRKYITKVERGDEEIPVESRVPNIDESSLATGTTATYKHKKDPVTIKTEDKITYKMTIYNEGDKEGRATKVVDQLPTGLEFSKVISGNFEEESYDKTSNTLNLVRKSGNETNLPAYKGGNLTSGTGTETIEIECIVTATPDTKNDKILTNVAWISEEFDAEDNVTITNQKGADRDSEPETKPDVNKDNMSNYTGKDNKTDLTDSDYYYKGEQDDDDFEKLILLPDAPEFDLKLIKRITEVNGKEVPERIQSIDVSKLNIDGTDRKTTADYQLNKEPVGVAKGDIVTYALRVYNEGTIDGYAQEITEDVPEGLQFLWSEEEGEELKADKTLTEDEKKAIEFNQKYLWGKFVYDDKKEKITQISTSYLDMYGGAPAPTDGPDNRVPVTDNLIKAFGHNDGTKTEKDLDYKEIYVKFKVVSENVTGVAIRNEAAITEDTDENGKPVDDRDSHTDEWHEHPDHEDDEDHDYIILQSFDLALRKFIIAVSNDTKIENNEYLKNEDGSYTRAPIVDTSELNTEDETGKLITTAKYNHTKEPVIVSPNAIVVYMLRVYNEGDVDGYASEIKDHLPPYLEYVDDEFNKKYGWEVSEDGRTVTTKYLAQDKFLINKATTNADGKIELSYKEVPIMCRVKENAKTSENITNIADITEYLDKNKQPAVDRDSQKDNVKLPKDKDLPGYKDDEKGSYVPGQQDDDDFEKVVVKVFDLALRKWVTQAIVIENGQQKVTQTGHDAWDEPEAVVKVELHKKKLNQVTVKFRYSIRVYNQGEIEGYAKEITDYIPEGLKFVAEDNKGWKDEGNNVISTRLLENTLLQPGEYADVEVLLTWVNNENNMGVMNNIAEISEDYNKYGVPDIDSTPDNQKKGEDDIDDAPVMLSISTGQMRIYFTLGFIILITSASGIILIKKFVL